MKQTVILGNIITVDEKRPFAKAAVVKNGVFSYIGSAEEAKKLAGADAQVLDYGAVPTHRCWTMVITTSIRALWSPTVTAALPENVL